MKQRQHIIRIIYKDGSPDGVKPYSTRKGADDEYKRLTQSGYRIYHNGKFISEYEVKRK